jgi:prepilin-type N-terminal cleavage/methylation domain-containing protein
MHGSVGEVIHACTHMNLLSRQKRSGVSAMTLVEVLIGMAIFGVLFISLYGGISSGLAIIRSARENLRATQVMLEKMETIRLYNWDQVTQNGYVPVTFSAPYWPADGTNGLQYHGTMTITNVPFNESYSADMRQVVVNVNWRSGTIVHRREMRTMVSRHGLQNYIY